MSWQPALNALLNSLAAALLVAGYVNIRRGRVDTHRRLMVSAFGVSVAFLVSYLVYHALHGSTRFPGEGAVRTAYLTVLLTHTVLAALVPFLALRTLWLAHRGRWDAHKRIARWTFPIWLYVSVTGVVIYVLLYHVGPRLTGG